MRIYSNTRDPNLVLEKILGKDIWVHLSCYPFKNNFYARILSIDTDEDGDRRFKANIIPDYRIKSNIYSYGSNNFEKDSTTIRTLYNPKIIEPVELLNTDEIEIV